MKMGQGGFTVIELVTVIVILGILAAVAVPRFIELTAEAEQAGARGVAGAISSSSAINFAAAKAGHDDARSTADMDCADAAELLLQEGVVPEGYTVTGGTGDTEGEVSPCEVSRGDAVATAHVIVVTAGGAGNGNSAGGAPPGQGGTPPGQGGTPPGQGGTPPGQGGNN